MTGTGISELVSKKPRRGRPPRFADTAYEMVASVKPEVRTRRGQQNVAYADKAIGVLFRHSPRFAWLCDREAMRAGRGETKWTILAELGRVESEAAMVEMAAAICDAKPRSHAAAVWIRRRRGVSQDGGNDR